MIPVPRVSRLPVLLFPSRVTRPPRPHTHSIPPRTIPAPQPPVSHRRFQETTDCEAPRLVARGVLRNSRRARTPREVAAGPPLAAAHTPRSHLEATTFWSQPQEGFDIKHVVLLALRQLLERLRADRHARHRVAEQRRDRYTLEEAGGGVGVGRGPLRTDRECEWWAMRVCVA